MTYEGNPWDRQGRRDSANGSRNRAPTPEDLRALGYGYDRMGEPTRKRRLGPAEPDVAADVWESRRRSLEAFALAEERLPGFPSLRLIENPYTEGEPRMARNDKAVLSVRIKPELAQWVRDEADRRIVGQSLLVEKAIELLQDYLDEQGRAVPSDQAV